MIYFLGLEIEMRSKPCQGIDFCLQIVDGVQSLRRDPLNCHQGSFFQPCFENLATTTFPNIALFIKIFADFLNVLFRKFDGSFV